MAETIMIANAIANEAFDNYNRDPRVEIPDIPGFKNAETHFNRKNADSGRIPALFIITRMSDGKEFAANYTESADDNFYAESPFYPKNEGETEFREVIKKTRIITEEYYDFA